MSVYNFGKILAFKYAKELSILEKNEKEAGPLLEKAKKENKGHGINVLFHGQHFGWFDWDNKKKDHVQFSINDFKNNSKVGKLEDAVAKLKVINLEDFK